MVKVTINGVEIEVPEGTNVVRAAEAAGQEIPHYCYHPGLSVAGNCRMCLVEIKALSAKQANPLPKLQIGCNTIVQDGMVVESANERVRAAQQAVLEFILVNHPLDCPICDQAGECKLQEYYMDYGRYHSRVELQEKVHKHKVLPVGPNIMLDQERCILCTRCIRFLEEFSETHELTITERGDRCELTLAAGASVDNDYATNIVDVCPVGALTARDFRFQSRVWYLENTESICPGCSTGCNVSVQSRRGKIYRIKPRYNEAVNGYWMCDYGRTTFRHENAGQRLRDCAVRERGRFEILEPTEAAGRAGKALRAVGPVAAVVSAGLSVEEGFLVSAIVEQLGGGPKLLVSAASSEIPDDGKLISTDRYPNRRGLLDLGFVEAQLADQAFDGVIVVRCDPTADGGAWAGLLERLVLTVVLDEWVTPTTGYADYVLAVASHYEERGTFVNRDGLAQRFDAAVPPPDCSTEGWKVLAGILSVLGGPVLDSIDQLREAMTRGIPISRRRGSSQAAATPS